MFLSRLFVLALSEWTGRALTPYCSHPDRLRLFRVFSNVVVTRFPARPSTPTPPNRRIVFSTGL